MKLGYLLLLPSLLSSMTTQADLLYCETVLYTIVFSNDPEPMIVNSPGDATAWFDLSVPERIEKIAGTAVPNGKTIRHELNLIADNAYRQSPYDGQAAPVIYTFTADRKLMSMVAASGSGDVSHIYSATYKCKQVGE